MYSSSESGAQTRRRRSWTWLRGALVAVAALAAVALVARVLAPGYVRRAINKRLGEIPGYSGQVDSVSLQVWRGAYRLDRVRIVRSSGKVREPFFSAKQIDFSIAWRELIRGRLVSDIYVTDGHVVFLMGPTEETSQMTADRRWQDVINDIFPIDITHLVIEGGIVEFIDTRREPRVDIAVRDLKVIATGLRNRPTAKGGEFPADIDLSGRTFGDGDLRLYAKLEPLADQPHFQLALELRKVSLPALNALLRAYSGVDVSRGQFELFGQMAMQKGHYEGYVKPFVERVEFKPVGDKDKGLGKMIKRELVAAAADLFKNRETKQIATRIPFSGDAKSFDVGTLRTILNGLHHGFVKALPQAFEGTTHPDEKKSTLPPVAPTQPAPGK
jgi:hypothetical protein